MGTKSTIIEIHLTVQNVDIGENQICTILMDTGTFHLILAKLGPYGATGLGPQGAGRPPMQHVPIVEGH